MAFPVVSSAALALAFAALAAATGSHLSGGHTMGSGFSSVLPGWKSGTSTVSSASTCRSRSGTSSGPPLMFLTLDMRALPYREWVTEQEWLEHQADQWVRDGAITPSFSPDLPPVSDCGWRIVLAPLAPDDSTYERIKHADEVEFYAVFGGREVTTRRPANGMNWSVPAWNR